MPASWKSFCSCFPQRWIIVAIGFLGSINVFMMRLCLSITITEMVLPRNQTNESSDETCPDNNITVLYKNETIENNRRYDWDEQTQGLVLSSFYWGYFITNIAGGILADKFGGKHTLGIAVLSTAILTLLTPISIELGGASALIVLRSLMGLGEGQMYPALNVLMAKWIPEDERSFAAAWTLSGGAIGSIVGMAVSGAIIKYSNSSWETVFYSFGIFGMISYMLNCVFCYNEPSDCPFISEKELQYLREKLKNTNSDIPPTPWGHILRSRAIWALMIVEIGNRWGYFMMLSDMPKYMNSVLKFSVDDNGYISSIPSLCMFISSCVISWIADKVIANGLMSTNIVRKIGCTISMVGSGIFLVLTAYAGCNASLAVILYTICMTLFGFSTCSTVVNYLDLTPNYAGSVLGFIYGIATVGGFLSPYVAGVLTSNQTVSEWRTVFWIVLVVFTITNTVFVFYGSTEIQEWNDPDFLRKRKQNDRVKIREGIKLLQVQN